TDNGPVKGIVLQDSRQFLGIPYAAPPVGDLRWQPPAAPARWKGNLDADHFAPHCPQVATPYGLASTSEDCLYLNVFAPPKHDDKDKDDKKRGAPVMVWLHPGAFQYGESDDFDASDLVANDVVVVTLNYRLGALGFMSHPALSAESPDASSGNYGLQD